MPPSCSTNPPNGGTPPPSPSSAAIDIPCTNTNSTGSCGCCCGGCNCNRCFCRGRTNEIDQNREAYAGEGTAFLLGLGLQLNRTAASYATTACSQGSVQDSSDAPIPFNHARPATVAPLSSATITSLQGHQHSAAALAQSKMERYMQDQDNDECPHYRFLEQEVTTEADATVDEDSGLFGPIEMERSSNTSMHYNPPMSSGNRSMRSSAMSSLHCTQGVGMSDVVRGAGTRFVVSRRGSERGNSYLRLN